MVERNVQKCWVGWQDAKRSEEQDGEGMDGGRRYAASSIVHIGAVEQRTMARGAPCLTRRTPL